MAADMVEEQRDHGTNGRAGDGNRTLSTARAIAHAASSLTQNDDVADVLAQLLDDCVAAVGASAAGIMVLLDDQRIEVLSASSHRSLDLELYQSQIDEGPCVDSIRSGHPVNATNAETLRGHWPAFAKAAAAAGFSAAHAQPMVWQGRVIGGFNIFRAGAGAWGEHQLLLAQAFADIATVAVVHTGRVTAEQAAAQVSASLQSRNVIEQAKGVLAFQSRLEMGEAYEQLKQLARDSGQPISAVATQLVQQAQQR
jgi:GAF domain-containing protein